MHQDVIIFDTETMEYVKSEGNDHLESIDLFTPHKSTFVKSLFNTSSTYH